VIIVVSTAPTTLAPFRNSSYFSTNLTWSLGIVGVELPREERNGGHLEQEYGGVKERL
jgi:hypothetical protein